MGVGKFYFTGESLKRSYIIASVYIIRPSIRLLHAPTLRNTLDRDGIIHITAREAGYAVTISKIGGGESRRGRRSSGGQEGEERGTRRRRKVQPKYRNPENPEETWSGRGRKPRWVEMALSHGRTLDDLAIKAA